MVQTRLLKQRQWTEVGVGETPRLRLDLIVEVDQKRLVETGLDEAVGVAVVAREQFPAIEQALDVLDDRLALEVRDRAGLGGRDIAGVADYEDVLGDLRLQRVAIGGDEPERIAEARRARDIFSTAMRRYRYEQVEGDLALIPAVQRATLAVYAAGGELGLDVDVPVREQRPEPL